MPAINKIDKYELGDRVLALSGEGKTTSQIAEIITTELSGRETISQPTVSRWLQKVRKDRSDQTKQIFHDHIKVVLPADLAALEEIEAFLLGIFRNLVSPGAGEDQVKGSYDRETRIGAGMKAAKIIETKLRFAGILDGNAAGDSRHDPVDLDKFKNDFKELATGTSND